MQQPRQGLQQLLLMMLTQPRHHSQPQVARRRVGQVQPGNLEDGSAGQQGRLQVMLQQLRLVLAAAAMPPLHQQAPRQHQQQRQQ